jgi:hypothetical protein
MLSILERPPKGLSKVFPYGQMLLLGGWSMILDLVSQNYHTRFDRVQSRRPLLLSGLVCSCLLQGRFAVQIANH